MEVVLYTYRPDVLADFYASWLDAPTLEAGESYRCVRTPGITLWLVQAELSTDEEPPPVGERRSEVPVKLGFEIARIEPVRQAITAAGGSVTTDSWEFAGYRRYDAQDPDGNIIQLLEPLP